jgi:hypothetical protein
MKMNLTMLTMFLGLITLAQAGELPAAPAGESIRCTAGPSSFLLAEISLVPNDSPDGGLVDGYDTAKLTCEEQGLLIVCQGTWNFNDVPVVATFSPLSDSTKREVTFNRSNSRGGKQITLSCD